MNSANLRAASLRSYLATAPGWLPLSCPSSPEMSVLVLTATSLSLKDSSLFIICLSQGQLKGHSLGEALPDHHPNPTIPDLLFWFNWSSSE